MKQTKPYQSIKLILATGFALFSMFFGSGNLVFPITVGLNSHGHYLSAAAGIILTGVVVPFLGVLCMVYNNGSIEKFLAPFGKTGTLIFSFFALSLMGPFGVLARCFTVTHGALLLLFPSLSLKVASLVFCLIILIFASYKSRIISNLALFLTPILLIAICSIAFFAIFYGQMPAAKPNFSFSAFKTGFFQGYQTMDLLAAFFFSQFVIKLMKKEDQAKPSASALKNFLLSAVIGGGMLSIVYFFLTLVGWSWSTQISDVAAQKMLGVIALNSLGYLAAPIVCLAIASACLTTSIVLTTLFADFFREKIVQNKISPSSSIIITLGIGFTVSIFDFDGIANFIGPILEMIYPALIALTLYNILLHLLGRVETENLRS